MTQLEQEQRIEELREQYGDDPIAAITALSRETREIIEEIREGVLAIDRVVDTIPTRPLLPSRRECTRLASDHSTTDLAKYRSLRGR